MTSRPPKKIIALTLLGLAALGLNFGLTCGSPGDVDPASCCATNGSCLSESGMSDPQACCEREEASQLLLSFQWNVPLIQKGVPSVAATSLETEGNAQALFRSEWDARGTPLKFPSRDLVKLYSTFLI